MNVTEDQFVKEVFDRLAAEHGPGKFAHLENQIRAAYPTEQHITHDDLDELFHGPKKGVAADRAELVDAYPLLNRVALTPYTEGVDDPDHDEDEDDEDEDDEDEDDEDEDDDE